MKKIGFILSFMICCMACDVTFAQRQVYNLNKGWKLSFDTEFSSNSTPLEIDLPHIWNLNAMTANDKYDRGQVSYVKLADIPQSWQGKVVYIRFNGASLRSRFFLNSKYFGTHPAGYTSFAYDVTTRLSYTGANSFELKVDNSLDLDQMPLLGDFNMYGGIHRNVEAIVVPKTHIAIDEFATDGVYVTPYISDDGSAEIHIKTKLCLNAGDKTTAIFSIKTQEGETLDSKIIDYRLGHTENKVEELVLKLEHPHLWNGINDPYLYIASVRLESVNSNNESTYDEVAVNFGVRSIEVNEDNQFLLNGVPYEIHGVSRIEDWPLIGNALREYHHDVDFQLIKEMGANAVRLSYFPQNDYFISLCDKAGIIVWSDIPFTGPNGIKSKGFVDSESFKENGKLQLTEMIMQQYNHPSLCFVGLYSELLIRGDNPTQYIEELNAVAKRVGKNFFTVASSNQDGAINDVTDLIGFNQSFGWKMGKVEDLSNWALAVRQKFPGLKIALSAYGAGGSIFQHQDNIEKPDYQGSFHPEEWQREIHEQSWKIISAGKYFWGSFLSNMFDYSVAHRTDGPIKGLNDYGLVTADRLVKKDAFYYYKANWNKNDKFVHIVGRRNSTRVDSKQQIKIYSNEDKVTLYLNGELQSELQNDGNGVFVWNEIELQDGLNQIKAVGENESEDVVILEKTNAIEKI